MWQDNKPWIIKNQEEEEISNLKDSNFGVKDSQNLT